MMFAATAVADEAKSDLGYKPRLDKDGWEILFDGKDLDAWQPAPDWAINQQGELHPIRRGSDIFTKQRYCDFAVDVEFKLGGHAKANSGVFLRVHDRNDPVQTGREIQILDNGDHNVPFNAGNACAAIYDLVPPSVDANRPIGQWNHYLITIKDALVTVEFNGQQVVKADLSSWTEAGKNPDGSHNKFTYAIAALPREGFLDLQNHNGSPVWFRSVRIKPLGDRKPKYTGKEPIAEVLGK
jgi:hypothetical protein